MHQVLLRSTANIYESCPFLIFPTMTNIPSTRHWKYTPEQFLYCTIMISLKCKADLLTFCYNPLIALYWPCAQVHKVQVPWIAYEVNQFLTGITAHCSYPQPYCAYSSKCTMLHVTLSISTFNSLSLEKCYSPQQLSCNKTHLPPPSHKSYFLSVSKLCPVLLGKHLSFPRAQFKLICFLETFPEPQEC